ncbi:hypothetical protein MMC24_006478 [Lignoscripta atroalba]|nr:hypothetical protein [Lignoscripta atroalba]
MLLIGLTGSIATGKSTVSRLLSQPPYSLPIIDADLLARKVVEPGTPGYAAILAHFSSTTPDLLLPAPSPDPAATTEPTSPTNNANTNTNSNGKSNSKAPTPGLPLNRAALGRRIFGDSPARKKDRLILNSIVHPAVRRAMLKAVLGYYIRGHWAVVLDIPLLFESQLDIYCGVVLVVGVRDPEIQMRRLRERDPHLSAREAEDRVRSQGDVCEKAGRALGKGRGRGCVVWNDGRRGELEGEVGRCVEGLREGSPRWWGWVLWLVPPLAGVVAGWGLVVNWWGRRRWEEGKGVEKARL